MAASLMTLIGSGTFVRGRVTGTGDLAIAGRIEGEVACSGELTVDTSGLVGASISARRIVVRGAVKGDLIAEESIVLEAGARVVGDLRAPRIAIAPGGLVRGHVQTGNAGAARPRAAGAAATRSTASTASTAKVTPARTEVRQETKKAPLREAAAERSGNGRSDARTPRAMGSAARVGPPPPVVPALKKGTKAVAHHKKR